MAGINSYLQAIQSNPIAAGQNQQLVGQAQQPATAAGVPNTPGPATGVGTSYGMPQMWSGAGGGGQSQQMQTGSGATMPGGSSGGGLAGGMDIQMGGGGNTSGLQAMLQAMQGGPQPAAQVPTSIQQIGAVNPAQVPAMPTTAPAAQINPAVSGGSSSNLAGQGATGAPAGIPAIDPKTGVPTGANSNTVAPSGGQTGAQGKTGQAPIYASAAGNPAEQAANTQAAAGNRTSGGVNYQTDPNNQNYQIGYDPGKGYQFSDPYTGQSSYNVNNTGWSPTEQAAQQTFQQAYGTPGGGTGTIPASLLALLTGQSASTSTNGTRKAT